MTVTVAQRTPGRFTSTDCQLDDFTALVDQRTQLADFPHAHSAEKNVLVYDARCAPPRVWSRAARRSRPSWCEP
jgi:hypothetical protein